MTLLGSAVGFLVGFNVDVLVGFAVGFLVGFAIYIIFKTKAEIKKDNGLN